jgi:tetratricopeptide (TPR) repeat protein
VTASDLVLALVLILLATDGGSSPAQLGREAYAKGDYAAAELHHREELKSVAKGDPEARASALANLGNVLRRRAAFAESIQILQSLLSLREKQNGKQSPQAEEALGLLGIALADSGKIAQSLPILERRLKLAQKLSSPSELNGLAEYDLAKALVRADAKFHPRADALIASAQVKAETTIGADSPDAGRLAQARAHTLSLLGKHDLAEASLRRALKIFQSARGPDHPETLAIESDLSAVLFSLKRYREAEPLALRATERTFRNLGAHPDSAIGFFNLGYLQRELGKTDEAAKSFGRVLEIEKKLGVETLSKQVRELVP